MKIEFLADGAEDCPLIRLFEFEPVVEVTYLIEACRDLASGRISEFALFEQPWVETIADSRFVWRYHEKNIGVLMPNEGEEFVLLFNAEAWREVEEKLHEFQGRWQSCSALGLPARSRRRCGV